MNPSMSTFSRLSMALGGFTLAAVIYCVYEFLQTQNLVLLVIPVVLLLVSMTIIVRQKQKQEAG